MALVTDDAVTLAVSDYSETSQVVTLFTRHNGKVSAMAKGAKRPKNRLGGPVDRLQCVQAVFSVRSHGGLGQLAECSVADPLEGLRRDLKAFYAGSYAAELVRMGTEELDPHPGLFEILRATLRRLSRGQTSAILVYRFEVRFLAALGVMPQLGACVSCGRDRAAGQVGLFSAAAGGLVCRRCRSEAGQGMMISGKALDALGFLLTATAEAVDRARLSPETSGDMRKLLRAYWPFVLGREPRATRWVTSDVD